MINADEECCNCSASMICWPISQFAATWTLFTERAVWVRAASQI